MRYDEEMKKYGGTDGKKKKDPDAPKRPPTAFFIFAQAKRPEVAAECKSVTEVSKKLGEMWKQLGDEEKKVHLSLILQIIWHQQIYDQQAAEAKKQYEQQKAAYDAKSAKVTETKMEQNSETSNEDHAEEQMEYDTTSNSSQIDEQSHKPAQVSMPSPTKTSAVTKKRSMDSAKKSPAKKVAFAKPDDDETEDEAEKQTDENEEDEKEHALPSTKKAKSVPAKGKRAKKNSNVPPKPQSAWKLYGNAKKDEITALNLSTKDANKRIQEMFKKEDASTRSVCIDIAQTIWP